MLRRAVMLGTRWKPADVKALVGFVAICSVHLQSTRACTVMTKLVDSVLLLPETAGSICTIAQPDSANCHLIGRCMQMGMHSHSAVVVQFNRALCPGVPVHLRAYQQQ